MAVHSSCLPIPASLAMTSGIDSFLPLVWVELRVEVDNRIGSRVIIIIIIIIIIYI